MIMMQASAALSAMRTILTQSKWVIIIALLSGSHYFAYMKGREHYLKEQAKITVRELDDKATKAVAKAATDSKQLSELKNENEKLLTEIDKLNTRTVCIPTDDELRVLERIYEESQD